MKDKQVHYMKHVKIQVDMSSEMNRSMNINTLVQDKQNIYIEELQQSQNKEKSSSRN